MPALGVLMLGMGAGETMASFSRGPSLRLHRCLGVTFVLAELQIGAPASAPAVALVVNVGSSYLALVMSRIGSAWAAFCRVVLPLGKHSLVRRAVVRLASTGFTASFFGFLPITVTFFRHFGLGVELVRRGCGLIRLWLLWFIVSGRAHRSMTAVSRDILGTY